jgi:uncharacterized integral membrane protein
MTSQPSPPRPDGMEERSVPWRTVLIAAVVVYGLLFVVLNNDTVKISFVFFSAETSLLIALLLAGALGFVAGMLVQRRRGKGSTSE